MRIAVLWLRQHNGSFLVRDSQHWFHSWHIMERTTCSISNNNLETYFIFYGDLMMFFALLSHTNTKQHWHSETTIDCSKKDLWWKASLLNISTKSHTHISTDPSDRKFLHWAILFGLQVKFPTPLHALSFVQSLNKERNLLKNAPVTDQLLLPLV